MVEMLTEMAKRANIEVNLKFEPWSRAQSDTQAGKDLAIIALTRTPEREPKYTWIVPLLSDPLWLHATRGDLNISALDGCTLNISVLRGTPQEDTLRQAGLTKLDLTTNDNSGAKMLKAGRVDAWFTRGMFGVGALPTARSAAIRNSFCVEPRRRRRQCISPGRETFHRTREN